MNAALSARDFRRRLLMPATIRRLRRKAVVPYAMRRVKQRLCGSQMCLPGAMEAAEKLLRHMAARRHCAYRPTGHLWPDKAFTPLSGITHHQKSKGCARICAVREEEEAFGRRREARQCAAD
ncbi:hypothetical protein KCP74_05925 [Salmonella enterica subsp. enterica]|nr:hypothetical protein KCP74_05925 [Salmonella enterica subsp. enterica]